MTYSIVSPRILPFTTIYFSIGYLVYKYKLLFVYCTPLYFSPGRSADAEDVPADRPYESRGQAWPLAFNRIAWGMLIFQTFMLSSSRFFLFATRTLAHFPWPSGLFIVRKAFLLAGLVVPLMVATVYTTLQIQKVYAPLSRYVNLSQACEVSHGAADDVVRMRRGHPVTRSQVCRILAHRPLWAHC